MHKISLPILTNWCTVLLSFPAKWVDFGKILDFCKQELKEFQYGTCQPQKKQFQRAEIHLCHYCFPWCLPESALVFFFFFFGCTIMSGSDNLGASTEPSFNSMKIASLLTTAISISILSLVSTKGKLSWVQKCSNPQHFLYLIILILTFKVSSDCIFDLSHKTDILFFRQKSWKNFLQ